MWYHEGELFDGDKPVLMLHSLRETPTGYECFVNPVGLLNALHRVEWAERDTTRKITKKGVASGKSEWILPWLRFESHIAEGQKDVIHLGKMESWAWTGAVRDGRGHLPYIRLTITTKATQLISRGHP